ncbi:Trafficking protein particle complex subunit 1 [Trachymyrmex septentrionalis]|uniref:Trafficking protein particle complex subunit n=1 Tax=Trachymyrmex septentrionalis TaxID=34720 RepID=A0A195FGH4_9HYME|nr:Trafficking protein particle complex subunit 1 [Trachymyrmex septentrionalis]
MLSVLLQLDKCIIQYYRRFSCARSLIASTPDDEYVQNSQLCPAVLDVVETSKQLLQESTVEAKLMYGMLFSIKSFVSKISPLDPKEGFLYYKTSKYTLHYFETPSGLKFVLNTDNASQNARELLQQLYREVYLEYVVKNPLCQLNEPIQSELFKMKVDELFKKSPLFLSRSL